MTDQDRIQRAIDWNIRQRDRARHRLTNTHEIDALAHAELVAVVRHYQRNIDQLNNELRREA